MSYSVPVSFIQQFDQEVKQAYQQGASLLRGTVRTRTNIGAERIYFPKLGAGESTQKARHADLVPMNLDHDRAYADMSDHYAPDYVDDLDQAKVNWNIASEYAQASGAALGRTTDRILISAMDATANRPTLADLGGSGSISLEVVSGMGRVMTENHVPLDRQRFAVISPQGLADLQQIEGVTSSDFVREQILVSGDKPAFWMGFNWIVHTMLPEGVRALFYHRAAVGHGICRDISTAINWIAQKDSWLINSKMSMGATIIDEDGVFVLEEG